MYTKQTIIQRQNIFTLIFFDVLIIVKICPNNVFVVFFLDPTDEIPTHILYSNSNSILRALKAVTEKRSNFPNISEYWIQSEDLG